MWIILAGAEFTGQLLFPLLHQQCTNAEAPKALRLDKNQAKSHNQPHTWSIHQLGTAALMSGF